MSYKIISEQTKQLRLNDLRVVGVVWFLGAAGLFLLIYIVMNPFRRLSEWVKALGQPGAAQEMDIDASTEIGEIAQAFSDITMKLRESQVNLAEQERLQKEMQVAQEIQQTLLPSDFPQVEGYEISSYYAAAKEVGGDYYDFVEVDKDTIGIVVADVSGKGVPGSLVMTMIRTALRTEARGIKDAAEVLSRVNDFVVNDMKKGMFVTLFYVIIDSKRRKVNYASAGHNPMILFRAAKSKTYYLNPHGFPIGISLPDKDLFRNTIKSDTISLAEDDILIIYTDGITEAMNRKRALFGEERFLEVIREHGTLPPNAFVDRLHEEILSFTEGNPQNDDITPVGDKM
jgi:sigma-B regulation protein RsbU (phosphoserine phosphatase)